MDADGDGVIFAAEAPAFRLDGDGRSSSVEARASMDSHGDGLISRRCSRFNLALFLVDDLLSGIHHSGDAPQRRGFERRIF